MAENTNTYTGLTEEQKTFYERTLLKRLTPELQYQKFGQKRAMPKNEGDKIAFRRFNAIAPKTTALTEGVTPNGSSLSVTKIETAVKQYGDYVTISDKLDMVGIDPVLTETATLLGESAGLTIDTLIRDEVVAGTNVQYAGGKANADAVTAADVVSATEIRKAVRTLRKNNAKPLEGGYFVGLIDPEVAYDIMSDPLWQDISKYSGGTAIMKGEIGKLCGVRFIETTNNKVYENNASPKARIHCTMIIGQDAYGVVDIGGSSKPEMIVKSHGSAGSADPLNQRATSGWKALLAAKRLNELSMLRIESGATA